MTTPKNQIIWQYALVNIPIWNIKWTNGKIGQCTLEKCLLVKLIHNEGLLCLVKDDIVDNICSKFHIIAIIFEFLVKLVIHSGQENESSFSKNHKNRHTCPFLDPFGSTLYDIATIPLVGRNFNLYPFWT